MPKNTKKPKSTKTKVIKIAIILAVVIAVVVGLYFLVRNESLYIPNKQKVKDEAINVLSYVGGSGESLFYDFEDMGCGENYIGLSRSVGCGFDGSIYFKNDKNLSEDLNELDRRLTSAGWKREKFSGQSDDDFVQVLNNEKKQLLMYSSPAKHKGSVAYLGYYVDNHNNTLDKIGELIKSGKIESLKENEYAYGVSVSASYYGCRVESFFKIGCILIPGEVKRS